MVSQSAALEECAWSRVDADQVGFVFGRCFCIGNSCVFNDNRLSNLVSFDSDRVGLMDGITGYSILFALLGLLFIGLGLPLWSRRVPPNKYYGCRTTKTLSDTEIWYEANSEHGRDLVFAGSLVFAASVIALSFGRNANSDHIVIALLTIFVVSVSVAAWNCFTFGRE